jgi:hypothetical protein
MHNIRGKFEFALAGEVIRHPVYAVYDWFVNHRPAVDWESLFDQGLDSIPWDELTCNSFRLTGLMLKE